ncbi:FGGY family carbohydrate kinase [Aureimonas sp. ME7]|uniref:FGGY family carbohydrate kinase n=1 Tax=Aureimonas sp. ME7 TaxID=2744252 RepID=UPI0015F827E0|nr:FGGY family carbohydrate kinase [Aureimonas sp. ME7]
MSALACGLDIGTTNIKVVLMDREGAIRWSRAVPTPRGADALGLLNNPSALLSLLEDLLIAGWREVGGGVPLLAIAGAGVGEDGLLVDAAAQPRGPSLPWFDTRAARQAETLRDSEAACAGVGHIVDAARTVAKWRWHAERGETGGPGDVWVALSDLPAVSWSGRPFISETLAARTAAYDVHARRWHAPMLAAAKAPPLPPVVPAGTLVGSVRSPRLLQSGAAGPETRIVAGGHDHPVAASYIRRFEPGAIVDSMGTAELLYGERAVPAVPALDPPVAYSVPVGGGAGLACLGVQELAAAMEPFRWSSHGDLVAALLDEVRIPGSPSAASQLRRARAQDAASLSALPREEALSLCRAAIEEAGFGALDMLSIIGGTGPIYVTGGWSRSDALMELRASLFGRAITRLAEDELTGAGAALVALSAVPDFDPARLKRPLSIRFEPRADWASAYRRIRQERAP